MANKDKLTQIDESNRQDHVKLTADDKCFFWREYTSRRNYNFSDTNNLISNLKKKPSSSVKQLRFKSDAIKRCADIFSTTLNKAWFSDATLVPVPPSKAKDHPDYDDRLIKICKLINQGQMDVRELVYQSESQQAAHEGFRPSVDDLVAIYRIDEALCDPIPKKIAIFDDLLTAGVHFRAMNMVLLKRFPEAQIVGFFIARRVFPNPLDDITDDF